MGVAEPDQIISDVLVVVLHGVIQTPRDQAQCVDGVLFGLIWEAETLKYHKVTYWVSVSLYHLEGGVRRRLLL